jgi:multidrug efflux pump
MLSRFFIDRPIFATVLSVAITLVGCIALAFLPIAQYPRITPPSVQVAISYPGASAQVVADTVGAPIEQQVNGIAGMLYMSSQSGNDGTYTLAVTFDVAVDLDGDGAKSCRPGDAVAADAGAEAGHHDPQEDARHLDDRQFHLAR